jgi:hypothetical protein
MTQPAAAAETEIIPKILDECIVIKKAELIALRANSAQAEEALDRARRAVCDGLAVLRAKSAEAERVRDRAAQAVQDKEQEITSLWAKIDRIIDTA